MNDRFLVMCANQSIGDRFKYELRQGFPTREVQIYNFGSEQQPTPPLTEFTKGKWLGVIIYNGSKVYGLGGSTVMARVCEQFVRTQPSSLIGYYYCEKRFLPKSLEEMGKVPEYPLLKLKHIEQIKEVVTDFSEEFNLLTTKEHSRISHRPSYDDILSTPAD